jgi:hypothetical protein
MDDPSDIASSYATTHAFAWLDDREVDLEKKGIDLDRLT